MYKVGMIFVLLFVLLSFLEAGDFNWGLKYGFGSSSIHGADRDYELRYNLAEIGGPSVDQSFIMLRSNERSGGLTQNAGLYASTRISKKTDSIRLGSELLWHRYIYNQEFKDVLPFTDSPALAEIFADSLRGRVETCADYITIPVLISFNQELSEEQKQKTYQGAYLYVGPSFSFLVNHTVQSHGGVRSVDRLVNSMVEESLVDSDPSKYLVSERIKTGSDTFGSTKTDLVVGAGFSLKDVFQFGIGRDEFVVDFRYTIGINDIGDADTRNMFTLRSIILSLGIRI